VPSPDWDFADYDVLVGGDVVGILDVRESSCHTLTLLRAADGASLPATTDCLHGGPRTLSHDGRTLATLGGERGENFGITRSEGELPLIVTDLETGANLHSGTLAVGRWEEIALVPTPGGWLTYVESSQERRLLDLDGNVVDHVADGSPSTSSSWPGTVFYRHPVRLGAGSTTSRRDAAALPTERGGAPDAGSPRPRRTDPAATVRRRLEL
jgi:hypothetical protein